MAKVSRFVLIDRDGTLIVERHYLSDPKDVELIPGVAEGLRQLREKGFGLIVITNQSGLGRGFFDQVCLNLIHKRMCELLAAEGVYLDGIYVCPHIPEDNCLCRKPRTGLVELAVKEFNVDLQASFVIGDKLSDIELGKRIGATTFLVRSNGRSQAEIVDTKSPFEVTGLPDYVVNDFWEAAQIIY